MSIRTLLVSAALVALVCGVAVSQPLPKPATPPPPTELLTPPPPDLVRPPLPRPTTPAPKSVEELLTELENVKAQKLELERKEKELKAAIAKKLEEQAERLKKLGLTSKNADGLPSDNKISAPYPLAFDKDSPKKDKEEIVVLLMPQLAPGTKAEFITADRELAISLAKVLPQQANEKKKTRVISPAQLDKFKMANPQWKQMTANEIGQKLGADFVLEIYLDKMRLYQPASLDNIYEGRAEVSVSIYEVGADGGDLRDKYPLSFAYPKIGVRDASAISAAEFKKQFLENLTNEILRQHVDTKPSEPDRVGRIIIEGNTKTPDRKILEKLELRPGQILQYPKLEEARIKLQKAGFHDVTIEVLPNDLDDTFKDIRIKVTEKGAARTS